MSNPLARGYMATIEAQQEEIALLQSEKAALIHEIKAALEAKATLNEAQTEMVEDAASLEFWASFDRLEQMICFGIEGRAA